MSNDPNHCTAEQNVRRVLNRYGFAPTSFVIRTVSDNRASVRARPGLVIDGAERCLRASGLIVERSGERLVVEA